jgi:TRAP-type C4-dicarboxylate transport system permease small subunit
MTVEKLFDWLAKGCAIVAGIVVVVITLLTTWSIVGRWLFSSPVMGDTEVIEFAMAVVVAGCLPICQWRGDNIIVDFFTTRMLAMMALRVPIAAAMFIPGMSRSATCWH